MIISVTSPVHGQAGNTTAALLISLILSEQHNKSVCLTHLSAQSLAFFTYLGLESLTDITCSHSQLVKLVREGEINPREMVDYCMRVNDKLDIFSNNSKSFSDEDMETSVRFITEKMPHDFVVLDIDINTALPLAKFAFAKSDIVIMTMTQMTNVFERYGEVFGNGFEHKSKTLYLCNQYTSEVGSVGGFAKSLGVKHSNCLVLHHSETLMKLSNTGKLHELNKTAKTTPLPEIEADLNRYGQKVIERYRKMFERREKR